jgi:endonuclease/exonuclease/phosphatase family metal-dependent hydrolase
MMQLTLLTANMWLLPPPASADNDLRLERLIRLIKKKNPDIVNLQEVWMEKYVKAIKAKLPQYNVLSPRSFWFNKSGLMTLTKFPAKHTRFNTFKTSLNFNPIELLASKGYLKTTMDINSKEFELINTHLYESAGNSKFAIRIAQAKKVLTNALKHNPTIVAGDFNFNTDEIFKLFNTLKKEKSPTPTYCATNKYTQILYNALSNLNGVHHQKPDYIFVNMKKDVSITSKAITSPLVSDHYPLLATIKIS